MFDKSHNRSFAGASSAVFAPSQDTAPVPKCPISGWSLANSTVSLSVVDEQALGKTPVGTLD
jgi:hypothetical protein